MNKNINWKNLLKQYSILIIVVAVILLLDQWTKGLVEDNLKMGETWMPWAWLAPYARIVHWTNTGAAFGMFQDGDQFFKILAIIVSLLILVYYGFVPNHEWPLKAALALQLSGALGNLIDRFTIGHVTDFISVGNFAVFNIADSSIVAGVIVLALGLIYMEIQERKKNQTLPAIINEENGTEAKETE
jgi:signal peptidase II